MNRVVGGLQTRLAAHRAQRSLIRTQMSTIEVNLEAEYRRLQAILAATKTACLATSGEVAEMVAAQCNSDAVHEQLRAHWTCFRLGLHIAQRQRARAATRLLWQPRFEWHARRRKLLTLSYMKRLRLRGMDAHL